MEVFFLYYIFEIIKNNEHLLKHDLKMNTPSIYKEHEASAKSINLVMKRFVLLHYYYYDYYNNIDTIIPFEAESLEVAEYEMKCVQEYNSKNPDFRRSFCGIEICFNDENRSCEIMTLEDWFDSRKNKMLEL